MREPSITMQVTVGVFLDVVAIVMLMYASGGVRSGLGVMLLVSLAAAGLITRGRLAYFYAATAALAVLLEQTFQFWRHDAAPQDYLQSGLTSVAFFATAGLASALARYARTSEQIAEERKIDLANLSQINELVIRDMQDGILVVDGEGRIRQHNPRALQLLGPLPTQGAAVHRRLRTRDRRRCSRAGARAPRPPSCNCAARASRASCRCTSFPSARAIPRPRWCSWRTWAACAGRRSR